MGTNAASPEKMTGNETIDSKPPNDKPVDSKPPNDKPVDQKPPNDKPITQEVIRSVTTKGNLQIVSIVEISQDGSVVVTTYKEKERKPKEEEAVANKN